MKKYKIECDNTECKKIYSLSEPDICPYCKSEEFTLIGKKNSYKYLIFIFSFLIIASFFIFSPFKSKEILKVDYKNFLNNYYDVVQNKETHKFNDFYANTLKVWFDQKNISLEDIIIKSNKYYRSYPFQRHDLNLDSLKVKKIGDNFLLSYNLFYAYRKDKSEIWKKFDLKISMLLNSSLKIISLQESAKNNIILEDYKEKYSGDYLDIFYSNIPLKTTVQIYNEKFDLNINNFDEIDLGLPFNTYEDYLDTTSNSWNSLSKMILFSRVNEVLYEYNHIRYGKLKEGLSYIDKLMEIEPNSFENHTQSATIKYLLGDYFGALKDINTAIILGNKFSDRWFYFIEPLEQRAQIQYMLENYLYSLNDIEVVIDYALNDQKLSNGYLIKMMMLKGEFLNANKDFPESCEVFETIIKLNKTFSNEDLQEIRRFYSTHFNNIKKVNYYLEDFCN
tara:strand:+ start:444 stop:1790 length:1347 start_codon:yes stop_codon:yes gene_type:complete